MAPSSCFPQSDLVESIMEGVSSAGHRDQASEEVEVGREYKRY
jgi:hypothetical protein